MGYKVARLIDMGENSRPFKAGQLSGLGKNAPEVV